jgi:hypothetical protein
MYREAFPVPSPSSTSSPTSLQNSASKLEARGEAPEDYRIGGRIRPIHSLAPRIRGLHAVDSYNPEVLQSTRNAPCQSGVQSREEGLKLYGRFNFDENKNPSGITYDARRYLYYNPKIDYIGVKHIPCFKSTDGCAKTMSTSFRRVITTPSGI